MLDNFERIELLNCRSLLPFLLVYSVSMPYLEVFLSLAFKFWDKRKRLIICYIMHTRKKYIFIKNVLEGKFSEELNELH